MNKYIVKNCPAIFYSGIIDEAKCWKKWEETDESCQNCTDCLIKQVIERCKEVNCPCEYQGADCWECDTKGMKQLADKTLQLFEIEECE